MADQLHCLYRFFDTSDVLLYIGITSDPSNRWASHRQTKPWWTQVAKITLETCPSRAAALAAEGAAIASERPLFNVAGVVDVDSDALDMSRELRSHVRSFDHSSDGAMPEYLELQKALDKYAHALIDRERETGQEHPGGRRGFIETVVDMISVLAFRDACIEHHEADDPYWVASPFRGDRRGSRLHCHYYCPTHHCQWACRWDTQILDWSR